MDNIEFTKINLRDFRHNLSQLKDALASGEVYQVIDRGNPLMYVVPVDYEISIENKKKLSDKEFHQLVKSLKGKFELKDEIKHLKDPMKGYRYLLRKKYLGTK